MSIALQAERDTTSYSEDSAACLHRFTVDDYHRMIESGVLGKRDRVQLLEGRIVDKMTHNPPHDSGVIMTQEIVTPLLPDGWHLRGQCAITTSDSEPEPDVAVVRQPARRLGTSSGVIMRKMNPFRSSLPGSCWEQFP